MNKTIELKRIDAAEAAKINQFKVLGTFEGECADADITNENGLDIPRDVWETVFASELHKKALEHGWYIGFLGHPQDPNCMDFEHACIVMRECHMDDDGKVYGKFDLVDTPVGRIVKAFIDAGVVFGISVRGAGDITNNTVEAETFVFRGFDLVTFPAYPDAIPTFSAIAASTSLGDQVKYKNVCAAVMTNMSGLNTTEAIDIVQSQFAKQSEPYKVLEDYKQGITASIDPEDSSPNKPSLADQKVEGMTKLYLEAVSACRALKAELVSERSKLDHLSKQHERKIASLNRVMSSQISSLNTELETVTASTHKLEHQLDTAEKLNLKYKQKIDASSKDILKKNSVIADLESKLNKTVVAATATQDRTSNLDAVNKRLREQLKAAHELIADYQQAYGNMYANAVGVRLDSVSVTATTSVKDLQSAILGGSKSAKVDSTFLDQVVEVEDTQLDDVDLVTL